MSLNGNSKMIMVGVLSAVVMIFIMLFTGFSKSVDTISRFNRENRERIVAVETKLESIFDKIQQIYVDQKETRKDIKDILETLRK